MPTATRCDLSPGDNLPVEEEETSPSCWGGFCRKGPYRSAAEKALLKAQFKLYKTQVRVHQIIQELWRESSHGHRRQGAEGGGGGKEEGVERGSRRSQGVQMALCQQMEGQ
ncbi:unnamed protein product [Lampetra planeri]